MSLELASFIKDLVATNPQGTDPKSQGDDHLRLIKGVLQSQFSGFTEGVAITKTESQINAMLAPNQGGLGGILFDALALDIDAPPAISRLFGIGPATAGTKPPTGVAGDVMLQLVYSVNHLAQLYFAKAAGSLFLRRSADGAAFGPWRPVWHAEARLSYSYGNNYANQDGAGIRKLNGVVHLEGTSRKTVPVATGEVFATLPVGMRPQFPIGVPVFVQYANLATQLANFEIRTNGQIVTSFVITTAGTVTGNCSFWLHANFVAVDAVT